MLEILEGLEEIAATRLIALLHRKENIIVTRARYSPKRQVIALTMMAKARNEWTSLDLL